MRTPDRRELPQRWVPALAALLLLGVAAPGARAQCFEKKIPWASEATAGFGASVAVTHDLVVVGAPEHTQIGFGPAGHVTVSRFVAGQWASTSLPLPTLLGTGDRFGHSVAVNEAGDVIVVGAPGNDTNAVDAGLVVIYRDFGATQGWQVVAEWPGIFGLGFYGFDVDVSGDVIVVGEPGGFFGVGAVNAYRRTGPSTWASDGLFTGANPLDGLGWAVAVSGDRMLIGVPFSDAAAPDVGRVEFYFYGGGSWSKQATIVAAGPDAHYGASVDVDGVDAIVGAPDLDSFGKTDTGAAYYYRWTGPVTSSLSFTHAGTDQHLGTAVAIHGGWGVASSPFAPGAFGNPLGAEAGTASIARWTGAAWENATNLTVSATDVAAGDHFGSALALGPGLLVAGSPLADGAGLNAGATYVYDLTTHGAITDLGFGLAGTAGIVPALSASGPLCGQTSVAVQVDQARPGAFVFLAAGATGLFAPFRGGTMVPNPDLLLGLAPSTASGELDFSLFWPPGTPPVNIYVQMWIVDSGGVEGLSATNGVLLSSIGG